MKIGKRLKFFRKRKNMKQDELGASLGFNPDSAAIRISQYENNERGMSKKFIKKAADTLDVSYNALTVPDINNPIGIMHTLFALEDMYGFRIDLKYGELCICVNGCSPESNELHEMIKAWYDEFLHYEEGFMSKNSYDEWRYNFGENWY